MHHETAAGGGPKRNTNTNYGLGKLFLHLCIRAAELGATLAACGQDSRRRRVEPELAFTVDFDGGALDQRAGGQARQHHGSRHFVHVHFLLRAPEKGSRDARLTAVRTQQNPSVVKHTQARVEFNLNVGLMRQKRSRREEKPLWP